MPDAIVWFLTLSKALSYLLDTTVRGRQFSVTGDRR